MADASSDDDTRMPAKKRKVEALVLYWDATRVSVFFQFKYCVSVRC